MIPSALRRAAASHLTRPIHRPLSTLQNNPHIHVFPNPSSLGPSHILSLLPTSPPTAELAIGSTTTLPPTPDSFTENPRFNDILQSVLKSYAHQDPGILSQAQAFASTSGSSLGSGGSLFTNQSKGRKGAAGGDGAGGASSQGGAGGGGRGGWVHLSDSRNPPDYGRIAWPEDIFGSLEIDGRGMIVGENGEYQPSGTYRVVTRDGILGLSDFLRDKVITRLMAEEKIIKGST